MEKRKVYVEVTQLELQLLDLIHNSEAISFHRHNDSMEMSKAFCELLGEPKLVKDTLTGTGVEWHTAILNVDGKAITASSFLERGAE